MKARTMTLREARKAQNWTIEELAKRAGLSHAMIQGVESGRIKPSILSAQKISKALHIPGRLIFPELWQEVRGAIEAMKGR